MWIETTNWDEIVMHVVAGEPVHASMIDKVIIHDTAGDTAGIAYTAITVNNPKVKIELESTVLTFAQLPTSLHRLICKFTNKDGHTIEKVEEWK